MSQADFSKIRWYLFRCYEPEKKTPPKRVVFFFSPACAARLDRPPGSRREATRPLPVAGGGRGARGRGLYFQGGFDRRRKYRAPQQVVGSSVPSATRSSSRNGFRYDYFFHWSVIFTRIIKTTGSLKTRWFLTVCCFICGGCGCFATEGRSEAC